MTFSQLRRSPRPTKQKVVTAMKGKPQRSAMCLRVLQKSPKKPNSANRSVAQVRFRGGQVSLAMIPGEGNSLQEYQSLLVRGGRTKDLPGIKLKVVRGKKDVQGVVGRKTSRSKYGAVKVKNLDKSIKYLREKNRAKQLNG